MRRTTTAWNRVAKEYINPINGDAMTFGEMIAWKLQGVIRRWEFLTLYTLCTLYCWIYGNDTVILWWNFASSFLAIVIEAIVGRAMFAVTKTDSAIIREIRKLGKHDTEHSIMDYAIDLETHAMVKKVLEILEKKLT